MIFDEVAEVMNQSSARQIAKRTGLNYTRVYRLQKGLPFVLDYNLIFALEKMGYGIKLIQKMIHEMNR